MTADNMDHLVRAAQEVIRAYQTNEWVIIEDAMSQLQWALDRGNIILTNPKELADNPQQED